MMWRFYVPIYGTNALALALTLRAWCIHRQTRKVSHSGGSGT